MCAGLGSPSTWLLDSWETHVSSVYDHNSQGLMNNCDLAHHPSSRTTLMAVVLIRCGGARVARTQRPSKGPTLALSGFGKATVGLLRDACASRSGAG